MKVLHVCVLPFHHFFWDASILSPQGITSKTGLKTGIDSNYLNLVVVVVCQVEVRTSIFVLDVGVVHDDSGLVSLHEAFADESVLIMSSAQLSWVKLVESVSIPVIICGTDECEIRSKSVCYSALSTATSALHQNESFHNYSVADLALSWVSIDRFPLPIGDPPCLRNLRPSDLNEAPW